MDQGHTTKRDPAGASPASMPSHPVTASPQLLRPSGGSDLNPPGFVLSLRRVLNVLSRYRYLILAVVAGGVAAGWWWVDEQKPRYKASVRVMITRKAPRVLNNVQEVVELGSEDLWSREYYDSQMELIRSREVAKRALNDMDLWNNEHLYQLEDKPEMTAEEKAEYMAEADTPSLLASRIETKPVGKSSLVTIEFEDTDEEFAMKVAFGVAKAYEQQNVAYKRKAVDDAIGRLKPMVTDWDSKLGKTEKAMRDFEEKHNIGTIPNARKNVSERLAALNTELTRLSVSHAEAQARADALERYTRRSSVDRLDAPELLASTNLQALRGTIAKVRAAKKSLEARYLGEHPEMKGVSRKLTSLIRSARREVRNIAASAVNSLQQLERRQTSLALKLEDAQKEELALSLIESGYSQLVQKKERASKRFQALNSRYTDAVLSAQATANNVHVLPPALNAPQVWPKRGLVLAAAAFLAMILALGLAALLEAVDNRIKSWEDIERLVGARVIGTVPSILGEGRRAIAMHIHENPTSPSAEALRVLRTNLTFAAVDRSLKTLLIASAMPEEGKTTVAISTAIAIASNGNKVVLVEADMRRPRFSKVFGLNSDAGLSTMLAGTDDSGVQETDIPGLSVLPAGPRPPNPSELLGKGRVEAVIQQLGERFDTVIFDSPPVLPVTDALLIATAVEGVVMVVRAGRTTRPTLRAGYRLLDQVGANIFGVVLNDRGKRARGYSDAGSYAYSYSYTYGDDPEATS